MEKISLRLKVTGLDEMRAALDRASDALKNLDEAVSNLGVTMSDEVTSDTDTPGG